MTANVQSCVLPTIKERELGKDIFVQKIDLAGSATILIDEIEFFSLFDQKFDFGGDGWSFDRRERYE